MVRMIAYYVWGARFNPSHEEIKWSKKKKLPESAAIDISLKQWEEDKLTFLN